MTGDNPTQLIGALTIATTLLIIALWARHNTRNKP